MELCEYTITQCLGEDCGHMPTPGIEQTAWIFNKKDIADLPEDATNKNVITDITLNADTNGFQITCVGNPFNGTNAEAVVDDYGTSWTENFVFSVPKGVAQSWQIEQIANGKFVVVIETNYEGVDGLAKYQILGAKNGLKMSAGSLDPNGDSKGRYSITLTAEDSPYSAQYLLVSGTLAATKTRLEALTTCEADDEE